MNDKKYSPMDIIISVIFVIWFIGSIVLMIFCGKTGRGGLAPAIIGQYLLVFGIAGIISEVKNKKVKPIIFIFPVVGLICIIATIIIYFGSETVISFIDKNMPYILMTLFLIVGIILVIASLLRYFGRKERCSYPVTARCTELRKTVRNGHVSYCPVYEIYYNGETIKLCDNVYTRFSDVNVDDEKEIMINPDKPKEYFSADETKSSSIIIGVIGFAIVLVMIFALVMTAISG